MSFIKNIKNTLWTTETNENAANALKFTWKKTMQNLNILTRDIKGFYTYFKCFWHTCYPFNSMYPQAIAPSRQ